MVNKSFLFPGKTWHLGVPLIFSKSRDQLGDDGKAGKKDSHEF